MIRVNTAEGGTAGVVATPENTGGASGTALTTTAAGGGTTTFTAAAAVGSLAYEIALGASQSYVTWTEDQAGTRFVQREWVQIPSAPTAETYLMRMFAGGSARCSVLLPVDMRPRMALGSTGQEVSKSPTALTPGWWVIEQAVTLESGVGGNGVLAFRIVNAAGQTVHEYTMSNLATGTLPVTQYRFGGAQTTVGWSLIRLDELQAGPVAAGWIGAYQVPNTAPTLALTGAQNVAAGAAVQASATATDDGSIASYAWSVVQPSTVTPTLSGASTATVALTAPAAGNLVTLRCVVTDNLGAQTTKTTEVRVRTTDQILRPYPLPGTGAAWTRTGGTSDGGAVADSDDGTYLQSPDLAVTESARRIRLTCPSGPLSAATITPKLWTDTGTGKATIRLMEGDAVRQDWPVDLTATPTNFPLTVAAIPWIVDWGNLALEVGVTS